MKNPQENSLKIVHAPSKFLLAKVAPFQDVDSLSQAMSDVGVRGAPCGRSVAEAPFEGERWPERVVHRCCARPARGGRRREGAPSVEERLALPPVDHRLLRAQQKPPGAYVAPCGLGLKRQAPLKRLKPPAFPPP